MIYINEFDLSMIEDALQDLNGNREETEKNMLSLLGIKSFNCLPQDKFDTVHELLRNTCTEKELKAREDSLKEFSAKSDEWLKESLKENIEFVANQKKEENKNLKTGITTIELNGEFIRKMNSKEDLKKAILKQLRK